VVLKKPIAVSDAQVLVLNGDKTRHFVKIIVVDAVHAQSFPFLVVFFISAWLFPYLNEINQLQDENTFHTKLGSKEIMPSKKKHFNQEHQ